MFTRSANAETVGLVMIALLGLAFHANFIASALAGFGYADPFDLPTAVTVALEALVLVGLSAAIMAIAADHVGQRRRPDR